ncbi:histidine kinase [Sanguibacter sp. 25GB23B1]|uniref:sensor histidine kinase n=1 Tax=unclassified Sanguibacter TaxID=2645534 RepID=UPI0032AF5190
MTRPDRLAAPQRRDVITAAVCWAVSVGSVVLLALAAAVDPDVAGDIPGIGTAMWWTTAAALTAQAVALAWARAAPRVVLLLVAAIPFVVAVPLVLSGDPLDGSYSLTSLALAVASYVAFVERPVGVVRPVALVAVALTCVGYLVTGLRDGDLTPGLAVASAVGQSVLVVGVPALVALFVATRREISRAREHELRALAREQDALVREARAQERTAMARELHDIAAHHLSGIAVMAAAIERQIATDPASATEGVRQVRSQSTAVLRDLRRLVGLLREGDAGELAVEALGGIAELTAQASATGMTVELSVLRTGARDVPGAPDADRPLGAGLGPLAQLTAFRMVQESLANAVQHAPGARCVVTVDDRDPEAVVVTVHNDAGSTAPTATVSSGGFGLVGMRERAELTAADLRYGPTIDGGWDVTLRLRRDATGIEPDTGTRTSTEEPR